MLTISIWLLSSQQHVLIFANAIGRYDVQCRLHHGLSGRSTFGTFLCHVLCSSRLSSLVFSIYTETNLSHHCRNYLYIGNAPPYYQVVSEANINEGSVSLQHRIWIRRIISPIALQGADEAERLECLISGLVKIRRWRLSGMT